MGGEKTPWYNDPDDPLCILVEGLFIAIVSFCFFAYLLL